MKATPPTSGCTPSTDGSELGLLVGVRRFVGRGGLVGKGFCWVGGCWLVGCWWVGLVGGVGG